MTITQRPNIANQILEHIEDYAKNLESELGQIHDATGRALEAMEQGRMPSSFVSGSLIGLDSTKAQYEAARLAEAIELAKMLGIHPTEIQAAFQGDR